MASALSPRQWLRLVLLSLAAVAHVEPHCLLPQEGWLPQRCPSGKLGREPTGPGYLLKRHPTGAQGYFRDTVSIHISRLSVKETTFHDVVGLT